MAYHSDEGYIKFTVDWTETPPLPIQDWGNLNCWRQIAYEAGFIGMYPDGIGYGNISLRSNGRGLFLISGSATGRFPVLDGRHFCRVTQAAPDSNFVACEGPIVASSESMSHAAIYESCLEVQSVIHAHHHEIWQRLLYKIPTTDISVPYGSPEMAAEIVRLIRNENLCRGGVIVTAGHEDGIFAFGSSLESAFFRLKSLNQFA
jgi:L-ribulose-5-phosphate 4-epimerase